MAGGRALLLAGTGMLTEVAQALTVGGWLVVLPCRRYQPIATAEGKPSAAALRALRQRGSRRPETLQMPLEAPGPGRAIWVEAFWDRPRELARGADKALGGPADLLVSWVHESYRRSVLGVVEALLAPAAPVVEVREGVGGTLASTEPLLVDHPTQQVVLGAVSERDPHRSLGHAEIAEGVLVALRRAMEGRASSVHQVGLGRPLVR